MLRLGDMIFRQRGSVARRLVHALISVALRLFFRRIEVSGVERAPAAGAVIFVLNHPNGLIDPALVFCALPRRVSFLAKSTLFRLPVIGWLMRTVEALPLYRRLDPGEDPSLNRRTFEACHALLGAGRAVALFPEGVSHNATRLLPLKTGAARIALGAISVREPAGGEGPLQPLRVMPVGLFYTSKTSFRSEALLRFGEEMLIYPVPLDAGGEPPRDEVLQLSSRLERALSAVTLNLESEEELEEVKKAEQLFSSIYETLDINQSLTDTFHSLRRLAEGLKVGRARAPERVERLRRRIARYEEELRAIGITPGSLSVSAHTRWAVVRHFVTRSALLALLSPLALVGALVHLPAYLLANAFAHFFRTHGADAIQPTVKILAAIILMPLTWLAAAAVIYLAWGWRAAVLSVPALALCGYAAVRSLEEFYDMRGWYKAVLVLLRRRGLFLRLLLERKALHDEIGQLVASE